MKGKRMKISMICYTLTGQQTGEKLKKGLEKEGNIVSLFTKSKYIPDSIKGSCGKWTGEQFETADSIIFIGAAGIAVRSIAPFIQSKKKDPAVLVVDELGKFVISLLSGHLGGANELACLAADILQAIPVVTTATDLEGKFAVDVFAKKNNCHIFRMKEAKEVSAALLAGEKVGFYSEFPWEGELPEGLIWCQKTGISLSEIQYETVDGTPLPEVGIAVTVHKSCYPFASTTHVVPPAAALGMGCRKNKESYQNPLAVVDLMLNDLRRPTGKGFDARLKFLILPLHLDGLKALGFPCTAEGEAAFFRFIRGGLLHDDGVKHDQVFALIIKRDDALADADHVGCHANAAVFMGGQCVQQILCCAEIIWRGEISLLRQKEFVFADFTNHGKSSLLY